MVSAGHNLDLLYVGTLPPHTGGSAVLASMLLGELLAQGHTVRALAPITRAALETAGLQAESARSPRDVKSYDERQTSSRLQATTSSRRAK